MIRHSLVHQSPGYICPFCPEREHKYPRPENLQRYKPFKVSRGIAADSLPRHVRVNHTDKDTNDPQLRDVLSQQSVRPQGRRIRFSL